MATSRTSSAKKPAATKPATKKTTTSASTETSKALTTKAKPPKALAATPRKTAIQPAEKKAVASATPRNAAPSPEQRYKMIQEAAYYLAERNGFQGGAMDYWMAAEIEIDEMLSRREKR